MGNNMNSHEILKKAVEQAGVKSIAAAMNLSPAMIYKWCEPRDSAGDPGAQNPLDRIVQIYELTQDVAPVEWLCEKTGGFRIDNPKSTGKNGKVVLRSTQVILREFSDLLEVISESFADDGRIDAAESKRIRKEWERLKVVAETFVASCEQNS